MARSSSFTSLLLLPLFVAACGDSGGSTSGGGGSGQGGSTTTTTGSGGAGGSAPVCDPPPEDPGTEALVTVTTVTAQARDETGALIQSADLQLCGKNGCLYATTNTLGQATFTNNLSSAEMDRPLFKPGDSLELGRIGYPYTSTSPSPLPGIFPRMIDSSTNFAPGGSATVAGATLEIDAAGVVVVNDLIYDDTAKQTFRAASVATTDVLAVTGDASFAMVYALGPDETLFCPPAKLTVDNYAALASGADVEFWGQALEVAEHFGGYGEWVKLSDGAVSSDGMTVSTAATGGLPVLVTVAIKLK